jgi:hypothetical protein
MESIFIFFLQAVWWIVHFYIWIFALIITIVRIHSYKDISAENADSLKNSFLLSVSQIENSDPILIVIAYLLLILWAHFDKPKGP